MKYPDDAPKWLKVAIESLEEKSQRAILTDEPARACGFASCLIELKDAIAGEAESLEQRRMKELHDLTFPATGRGESN
jgi:hypothetical protein